MDNLKTRKFSFREIHWWDSFIRLLLLVYIGSMIWINFHSALWYRMDCYTYAYEGRLMHESLSFFPEGWVFSNQFHIVSSPNLASLFYGFTNDSIIAMAISSSLFIFLVLFSFLWCFKPFIGKQSLWVGALALLGGIIFGTSAALYISGLQVLYTMCSYYACYLIGILLTLGIWLRFHSKKHVPIWLIVFTILLNFALGMQSLREMLVLVIPLFITEIIFSFYHIDKGKTKFINSHYCLIFVCGIILAELAGHFFIKALHIPTSPNIGGLELDLLPAHLMTNLWASIKNLLRISGLSIAMDGLKYIPLSICALCVALTIPFTLFLIIKERDRSPLALSIVFSLLSILCVFGIGVFLMRTRDIYYFVYWLLAALCIVYLLNRASNHQSHILIAVILTICGINYSYNFLPDFQDYKTYHNKLESFSESIANRGIKMIYCIDSMPIISAASHDKILSQAVWPDLLLENGYPFTVFVSDKHTVLFDDYHYDNSLICMSDYFLNTLDSAPLPYREAIFPNIKLYDRFSIRGNTYLLYRTKKRIIAPIDYDLIKF